MMRAQGSWGAVLALGLVLVACGDDSGSTPGDGSSTTAGSTTDGGTPTPATTPTPMTTPTPSDDGSGDADSLDPMPLPPHCGDGVIDPDEECDDGNLINHDGCTNMCTVAVCGDAMVQNGEECDDGNRDLSDDCTVCEVAHCGDGYLRVSETCDDGNGNNNDGCVACEPARCGDGYKYDDVEECDGEDLDELTCADLGYAGGTLGCTKDCLIDESDCELMTPMTSGMGMATM